MYDCWTIVTGFSRAVLGVPPVTIQSPLVRHAVGHIANPATHPRDLWWRLSSRIGHLGLFFRTSETEKIATGLVASGGVKSGQESMQPSIPALMNNGECCPYRVTDKYKEGTELQIPLPSTGTPGRQS